MKIKWKTFRKTYPYLCTKCGKLSNMKREFCENCGTKNSLREISKEDYLARYGEEEKKMN
ncbi:MAG: hypothetical protein ACFE85_16980 [Candidatus Hodarchaeota archaeon]